MSKTRKSLTPWMCCDNCQCTLTQKDLSNHASNCPPSNKQWTHSYILNGILYSKLEASTGQDRPKNISEREMNNMVFMAQSTLQYCEISIGSPVVITSLHDVIVKTAWPTNDKTLTSVSMTKEAMGNSKVDDLVKVQKLFSIPLIAQEITVSYLGKEAMPKITPEMEVMLKSYNDRNIYCIGNRITVPYYGKTLVFKIVEIKTGNNSSDSSNDDIAKEFEKIKISEGNYELNEIKFCKAFYCTKWKLLSDLSETKEASISKITIDDIGGYGTLIDDLRDVLAVALGKWKKIKGFNVTRGILLYGTGGVGKSMIANAVISEFSVETFSINSSKIQRKHSGETEDRLTDIFTEAKLKAPSVILLEDIDALCPRKNSSSTENEKRIYTTLVKQLDDLQMSTSNVVVLATTSRPDFVDSSLRRPGRLSKEFEVSAPTPHMRRDILKKFLDRMPNILSEEDVDHIAFTTHGFVGADLYGLCSEGAMRAIKRHHDRDEILHSNSKDESEIKITLEDMNHALTIVKPSAMKEVLVEVPNVSWSEVGGQKNLKFKLKQAVEWPLRHPEAFTRLGICPPRGVLMFGPPGCSKTMIAKALATESKLNFLNIKGPELFSKWVGESERAVREVFRKARQVAPSIIFIDEIDALGTERGSASSSGGSNVQERVLAQLLTELDGVTALGNVTLVAATNRPDRIDKALLRPGRLDRIVYVPLPDAETRKEIFEIKFRKMPIAEDVNIYDLVDLTEGYSGAEVQAICHEAAMNALEEDIEAISITKRHFKAALSIVTPRTPPSLIQLYDDYMSNSK